MNVYILLPNDGEFEFEANMSFHKGDPGCITGLPENCWPATPDEAEFADYGPFYNMYDAVYTACWMFEYPMSEEDIARLADRVEEETIQKYLDQPAEEYDPGPDYDDWDN